MVNIKFDKTEKMHLILGILILSFIFGFDDKRPSFVLSLWLSNLFFVFVFVVISVLFRELVQKYVADKLLVIKEYRLWGINRLNFRRRPSFPMKIGWFKIERFYIGAFIGLLVAFVSKGKFFFAAIGGSKLSPSIELRSYKELKELQRTEVILISVIGPLASLFLAIVFKLLNWDQGVLISSMISIYSMLPFPNLDGGNILFKSPFTYLFFLVFIILSLLLLGSLNFFFALILAVVVAFLTTITYYYFSQK
ncbi:MAG: hypothetical protein AABW41_03220 [Nanoarchaeota archaeon]